jgi:ribosomal protein S18 acetylase RimI-like enzyme
MAELKNSTHQDLRRIAECHRSAFPDSLSSAMGLSYLSKMIGWYLSDDKKFLFHLEEDSKVIGYCGGMINDGTEAMGSASGMIQFSFNDAVKAIAVRPWLLFNKELTSKLGLVLKNIKKRFRSKKLQPAKSKNTRIKKIHEPVAGLVVIGVAKEYMGKGYGSLLLKEFENKAKELGIKELGLSVRSSNTTAIKSYERNGWVVQKETADSFEMGKTLN